MKSNLDLGKNIRFMLRVRDCLRIVDLLRLMHPEGIPHKLEEAKRRTLTRSINSKRLVCAGEIVSIAKALEVPAADLAFLSFKDFSNKYKHLIKCKEGAQ